MNNQINTTHTMHLDAAPFAAIADGRKTIELRLYDAKRRRMQVGDVVQFVGEQGSLTAQILALHVFADFAELYSRLDLTRCGYTTSQLPFAHPSDMEAYYSTDQQREWGVVGIEFRLM